MKKQNRIILSIGALAALVVPTVIATATLTQEEIKNNNKPQGSFGGSFTQYSEASLKGNVNVDSQAMYANPTTPKYFPEKFKAAELLKVELTTLNQSVDELKLNIDNAKFKLKSITDAQKKTEIQKAIDIAQKDLEKEIANRDAKQAEYNESIANAWRSEIAASFEDKIKNAKMTIQGQNFRKASDIAIEINSMKTMSAKLQAFKDTTGIDFKESHGVTVQKFELFADPDGTITIRIVLFSKDSTGEIQEVHGQVKGQDNETVSNHSQPLNLKEIAKNFDNSKFLKNIEKKASEVKKEIDGLSGVEAKLAALETLTGVHQESTIKGTEIIQVDLTAKDGVLEVLFSTKTVYATTKELVAKVSIVAPKDKAIDVLREQKRKEIEKQKRAAMPPVDHSKEDRQKFMGMIAGASAAGLLLFIIFCKLMANMVRKIKAKREMKRQMKRINAEQ